VFKACQASKERGDKNDCPPRAIMAWTSVLSPAEEMALNTQGISS